MSHSVTLVLVEPKYATDEEALEARLETLLAPFNEDMRVPPRLEPCFCVGGKARREARAHAETVVSLDALRGTLHAEVEAEKARDERWQRIQRALDFDPCGSTVDEADEEYRVKAHAEIGKRLGHDARWQEAITRCEQAERDFLATRTDAQAPDPKCEECKGTGKSETTYNPQSKWDWWTIGGRWTGMLRPDYKPYEDPRNFEPCDFCGGTGKRNDALGRRERLTHPGYSCNACRGKGTKVKFATKLAPPPPGGNWRPVREILDFEPPFAILTPDGRWQEHGDMGWFGLVRNEKSEADWKAEARAILADFPDYVAVVVDVHI